MFSKKKIIKVCLYSIQGLSEEDNASVVEYVSIKNNTGEVKWSFHIGEKHIQSLSTDDIKSLFFVKPSLDDDKMMTISV